MSVARSRGVAAVRRCSITSSEMSAPSLVRTSTALSSNDHTWRRSSRLPRTSAMRAMWGAPSVTIAQARESWRIQPTCSAEEVS